MASNTMTTDLSGDRTSSEERQARWSLTARVAGLAPVYARIALGTAFLSSVADRFGLWGRYGAKNVSWGDFGHFIAYTGMVNSFLPAWLIPSLAWMATIAETMLGLGLILGIYRRVVAIGSATLLLMFASAMTVSFGVKSAIDYAVFSASACAFLLFAASETRKREEQTTQRR